MNIYQSLYLNADWWAAGLFAISHTICAASITLIFVAPQYLGMRSGVTTNGPASLDKESLQCIIPENMILKLIGFIISILFDLIIASPIIATQFDAFKELIHIIDQPSSLASGITGALGQSLTYAIPSAILSTAAAWCLARAYALYSHLRRPIASVLILMGVFSLNIVPSMANAYGFMVLRSWLPEFGWSFWPIVALHGLLILPFLTMIALQIYMGEMKAFLKLRNIIGISTNQSIRTVEWPLMKKQISVMIVIALAISLNETSIVSMLGTPESPTLTIAMIQMMGHYRFADSAIVSAILIFVTALALSIHTIIRSPKHGIH